MWNFTAGGPFGQPYPSPVMATASGGAGTNAPALAAVAGKTNYLEGFDLTGGGATGAGFATVTITGLLAGTLVITAAVAAGATAPAFTGGVFSIRFPTPLPASAVNTAITVSCGTYGTGNTSAQCTAYGFYA
jgi:hypothetical protein